jgi:hypothetical protein
MQNKMKTEKESNINEGLHAIDEYDKIILPKTYLMRWNPAISSFKEEDYEECFDNMEDGNFHMNWSIYEWQEARRGDIFYMLRTGDDKAGIVFRGFFISDPYIGGDWAGTTKRRCYVDMVCHNVVKPDEKPVESLEKLKKAVPKYNWEKGHSGELLSDDIAEKLYGLMKDK